MRYLAAIMAMVAGQLATRSEAPKPRAVTPPGHYLAQCPSRWTPVAQDTVSTASRRGVRRIMVKTVNGPRHLVARPVGRDEWAVVGPAASRDMLRAAGCTILEYDSLGSIARAALRSHLTCCGEMTWRGRTYHSWPCSWAAERAIKVIKDGGTGPGVTAGRPACPAVAAAVP